MRRPGGLLVAVALLWLAAVVSLLEGLRLIVAGIAMSGSPVEAEIEATLVSQGIMHVSGTLVTVGVLLAGLVLLVLALARVVISVYLLQGRNWARIVTTLLVLISLVGGVAYLFDDEVIRGVLTIGIEAVVLYLLFNSRSNEFFTARVG